MSRQTAVGGVCLVIGVSLLAAALALNIKLDIKDLKELDISNSLSDMDASLREVTGDFRRKTSRRS